MTSPTQDIDWCCVCAVNKPDVLAENLAASPALAARPARLNIQRDPPSSSIAYNCGLDETEAEIVVFAHQDVYLPAGWDQELARCVQQLDALDPNWAVAGLVGKTPDNLLRGKVWSTGLASEIGDGTSLPAPTASVDELLIILRRSSGLRFDPDMPSFHLYGTDIVQTALQMGMGAYVVSAPVVHNSQPVTSLKGGFDQAYAYLQEKLAAQLPVPTLVARIETDSGALHSVQDALESAPTRRNLSRLRRLSRVNWRWLVQKPSPQSIAAKLGYERPTS